MILRPQLLSAVAATFRAHPIVLLLGSLSGWENDFGASDYHAGAELDLLVSIKGKQYGFEFKLSDAPGTTRSMHIAMESLGLEKIFVIYPGNKTYPLAPNIEACPLAHFKGIESL